MTSNQKLLSLLLGAVAAVLVVAQFAMGQILTSPGTEGDLRVGVLKAHKHSGHLMVAVCLVYILMTMWWIVNSPTRRKGEPSRAE